MRNLLIKLKIMREKKIKSIKKDDKEYTEVKDRLRIFRTSDEYRGYALTTKVIKLTEKRVVMQAIIWDQNQRAVADGIAKEVEDKKDEVNAKSHIENCQTSAWGRALANLGIGIDDAIASASEMISTQKEKPVFEEKEMEPVKSKPVQMKNTDIHARVEEKEAKDSPLSVEERKEIVPPDIAKKIAESAKDTVPEPSDNGNQEKSNISKKILDIINSVDNMTELDIVWKKYYAQADKEITTAYAKRKDEFLRNV